MKYGNFEQSYIIHYLKSHAELNSFYVFCINDSDPGLIHYFDEEGVAWSLMEDDDELVDACLEYLKATDTPIFVDVEKLKAFEAERSGTR